MPLQPTNTEIRDEILAAIDERFEKLERGQATLFDEIKTLKENQQTRFDGIEARLDKIVDLSTQILESQHQRDLNLAERVDHLEQGAAA